MKLADKIPYLANVLAIANADAPLAACEALPSRASIAGRWRHRERAAGAPGARELRPRHYRHGCAGERYCWSDALVPEDDRYARLVIARAARRLGRPAPRLEQS